MNMNLNELRFAVNLSLNSAYSLLPLRRFLFARYEGDEEIDVEPALESLLPVLEPYVEHEEALGDPDLSLRLNRLQRVLNCPNVTPERVFFALEFDAIRELVGRLLRHTIDQGTFERQLVKLSPATFDLQQVSTWALRHAELPEMDVAMMG